jgi:antitoxin component YwqK of YwqJK toxin-antitoxin module
MKYKIISKVTMLGIVGLLLCVLQTYAQEPQMKTFRQEWNEDKTILKVYYANGKIKELWHYKQEMDDGSVKLYIVPNGVAVSYYETGELQSERPYYKGDIEGIEKFYYKSGNLKTEKPFSNDKENGTAKYYYESSTLKREIPYKDGMKHGVEKRYNEEGVLINQQEYLNDEPVN